MTEQQSTAPRSVQAAILVSAALVLVQGILLAGAALLSIGASPVLEVILAIVLGVAVTIVVPACVARLLRGRPKALPIYLAVLGVLAVSGVVRTALDPSFGSVAMIVLSVTIAALLLLPSARTWAAHVGAAFRR